MIFKTDKTDIRCFMLHPKIVQGRNSCAESLLSTSATQAQHLFGVISEPFAQLKKLLILRIYVYSNPLPTFQLEVPAALFSSFILSPNSWWYNKKVGD